MVLTKKIINKFELWLLERNISNCQHVKRYPCRPKYDDVDIIKELVEFWKNKNDKHSPNNIRRKLFKADS